MSPDWRKQAGRRSPVYVALGCTQQWTLIGHSANTLLALPLLSCLGLVVHWLLPLLLPHISFPAPAKDLLSSLQLAVIQTNPVITLSGLLDKPTEEVPQLPHPIPSFALRRQIDFHQNSMIAGRATYSEEDMRRAGCRSWLGKRELVPKKNNQFLSRLSHKCRWASWQLIPCQRPEMSEVFAVFTP